MSVIGLGVDNVAEDSLRRGKDRRLCRVRGLECNLHPMLAPSGLVHLGPLLWRQRLVPNERRVAQLRLVPPLLDGRLPGVILADPPRELLVVIYRRVLLVRIPVSPEDDLGRLRPDDSVLSLLRLLQPRVHRLAVRGRRVVVRRHRLVVYPVAEDLVRGGEGGIVALGGGSSP